MGSMTHWDECWKSGRDHYGCALARLEREVKRRRAAEALIAITPAWKVNVNRETVDRYEAAEKTWQQLVKEAGDASITY